MFQRILNDEVSGNNDIETSSRKNHVQQELRGLKFIFSISRCG